MITKFILKTLNAIVNLIESVISMLETRNKTVEENINKWEEIEKDAQAIKEIAKRIIDRL